MSFKFYKNNRIVPPVIAFFALCFLWVLIDPSAKVTDTQEGGLSRSTKPTSQDIYTARTSTQKPALYQDVDSTLASEDVLLILKTGATALWKRLPIHLSTSLSPERISPSNTVIYSEIDTKIGNHTVVDILAQLPPSVKDTPDFELYHAIRDWDSTNTYIEQTGLPGDGDGPPGGLHLDKYKFLPLLEHAGTHWPNVKWYIYTEDDTYMFLPNVLLHLSAYDHRKSHWLGAPGEKLGTTFAHGGSGFALSRAAWEQSFGTGGDLSRRYQGFVDEACCGDYALGKVLNDFGVRLGENNGDGRGSGGFNRLAHWEAGFSKENWCRPVLTWHRAHNRDIARYYELERSWDFRKPLNYGDFYASMIGPSLSRRKEWWDNLSSRHEVTSTTAGSAARPEGLPDTTLWANAWKSADSCEAACRGWSACVQWYYYEDDCRMDDKVFMGHGWPKGVRYRKEGLMSVSGWVTERINAWKCDE